MDAKEDLLSATSHGSPHEESLNISPSLDNRQTMEIDRNISNRKR